MKVNNNDNSIVKKVLTFKSGQFIFSRKYSDEELAEIIIEARVLYNTVTDLPILPNLASQIEEELIIKSIFGTASIEGNPLSVEDVAKIVANPSMVETVKRGEKEISNLRFAYNFFENFQKPESSFKISEDIIKLIHKFITEDIEYDGNYPGQYRNHIVNVGDESHGGIYTPPKIFQDIKKLMKEFIVWINSDELLELNPLVRAALAHYHLGLIHPFGDGNGRTARVIEAMLLRMAGIKYVPVMLSNFYYQNIDDYFFAFSRSIKNKNDDITPFLKFTLQGVVKSLYDIKERIIFFIRKFTLRDYYAFLRKNKVLTQRQHDFLNILLEYLKPFELIDLLNVPQLHALYRNVSIRTVRRDLKKMFDENLLIVNDGKYELNLRKLD